ncbi:Ribulose bisphosphate carboxylase/oxygenase activase protein [Thalictrum thalictroides]|uniref:Ribulose bisphosphate carboxylase/oxygenase activase protein n=1 Tax=Thalictrum thalictroides TaxID=46969 RepID=A0A7J6WW60_THATH|nr:Ribulose bisphosphate carboxylase/oxygenase activase protein [Thalictrum thalictroides]
MSAGELESDRAGEPGKLIRERYRTASQVVQNQGKMSCLMVNDIDAGLGRFGFTQMTVNNQIVVGTLMNLCDNPKRVSIGQDWRDSDITHRIPIIWVDDIGGVKNLGKTLLKRKKDDPLVSFVPPKQTVEALLESGYSLLREQQLIMETKLSKEYMKNMDD